MAPTIGLGPLPGDIIFCHTRGFIGRMIRLFTRSRWSHVAVLKEQLANGDWTVYQAEGRGVTDDKRLSRVAIEDHYEIVSPPRSVNSLYTLTFMKKEVGRRYGFLTIASIALDLLTGTHTPCFMLPDTWICSAVAAEALRYGGWLHNWPNIYQVNPGALYEALRAESATRGR